MDRRTFNKLAGVAAIGAISGNVLDVEAEQTAPPPSVVENSEAPSPLSLNQVVLEALQLGRIDADPLALEQSAIGEQAKHPGKHS